MRLLSENRALLKKSTEVRFLTEDSPLTGGWLNASLESKVLINTRQKRWRGSWAAARRESTPPWMRGRCVLCHRGGRNGLEEVEGEEQT